MTIKEFILRAMEYAPMTEEAAQTILRRILGFLGYGVPKQLPEPKSNR